MNEVINPDSNKKKTPEKDNNANKNEKKTPAKRNAAEESKELMDSYFHAK
jgi:hypothetical protein